jgi:predicted transcriptional regulator
LVRNQSAVAKPARIETDALNPELWEEVGGPDTSPRTLGASITIRLDPELAERLRAIARRRGLGYTSLARQMLEERINQYEGGAAPSATIRSMVDKKAVVRSYRRLSNRQP